MAVEPHAISNGDAAAAAAQSEPPRLEISMCSVTAKIASARLIKLAESLKLEHQLMRVPLEQFKKTMRANHRSIEKEVSVVLSTVKELSNESVDSSTADAVQKLNSLVSRLQGLKRKLEEGNLSESLQVQRCRARLEHLDTVDVENQTDFDNTRLKRILVDYLLRLSCYDTAAKLAETSNIQEHVDIDVFLDAKKVIDALQNKQAGPALAWCSENKSRLKKTKSKLEFQLRLQEFIELVRADNYMQAITYARKYLAPWGTTCMKELQRVVATLAFKRSTECSTYKILFDPKQWDYLVEHFKQEFCKLYGMTLEPLLNIYLQAGLSALKTPFCFEDYCPKEDPLSQETFRKLSSPLPFSKQHQSKLVCYISKEPMDTENPPLVLPNGYLYSTKVLEDMAKKNDGKITCPRTGYVCNYGLSLSTSTSTSASASASTSTSASAPASPLASLSTSPLASTSALTSASAPPPYAWEGTTCPRRSLCLRLPVTKQT